MKRKLPELYMAFPRTLSFNQTFPQDCNNKGLKMGHILTRVVFKKHLCRVLKKQTWL